LHARSITISLQSGLGLWDSQRLGGSLGAAADDCQEYVDRSRCQNTRGTVSGEALRDRR
jgi:hypothetical protein